MREAQIAAELSDAIDVLPSPTVREAQIWIVVVRDIFEPDCNDAGSVYMFDESQTEAEVLKDLWQEWVLEPYMEDKENAELSGWGDVSAQVPSWEALHELTGDYVFTRDLRTIKVRA